MIAARIDFVYGQPNGCCVPAEILENLLTFASVDRGLLFDNDDRANERSFHPQPPTGVTFGERPSWIKQLSQF
jgi:hypothetical protein